jgi:uncharacterized protein
MSLSTETRNAPIGPFQRSCIAFEGSRCIASGSLSEVALKTKQAIDRGQHDVIVIFDGETSALIEIDFRGTPGEVLERLPKTDRNGVAVAEKRGPGRPKLGVVGREVTLLPRHWDWLDEQPGGASVALRKLVETAKRSSHGADRARRSQEAVHRFMYAMAGNLPGFEEASRAFYAGNRARFNRIVRSWPADLRDHLGKLVTIAFRDQSTAEQE